MLITEVSHGSWKALSFGSVYFLHQKGRLLILIKLLFLTITRRCSRSIPIYLDESIPFILFKEYSQGTEKTPSRTDRAEVQRTGDSGNRKSPYTNRTLGKRPSGFQLSQHHHSHLTTTRSATSLRLWWGYGSSSLEHSFLFTFQILNIWSGFLKKCHIYTLFLVLQKLDAADQRTCPLGYVSSPVNHWSSLHGSPVSILYQQLRLRHTKLHHTEKDTWSS